MNKYELAVVVSAKLGEDDSSSFILSELSADYNG